MEAGGNGTENGKRLVFGKAYSGQDGGRAHEILERIAESEAGRRGDVIVPRPYRYDAETGIVWQGALQGRPILKNPDDRGRLAASAAEIGTRLAALHGCGAGLPVEMTLDFECRRLREASGSIRTAFAAPAERCAAVVLRLLEGAHRLGPAPLACLHGSFKPSHVLATPTGIAFIDLDGANRGDPASDLGRFVAHLTKLGATGRMDPEVAKRAIEDLCAGYQSAAVWPVPRERIDWMAACHLIVGALDKSVKRMDSRSFEALATAAEELCP